MTRYVTVMFIRHGKWGVYTAYMGAWKLLKVYGTKAAADSQAMRYKAEFV